MTVRVSDHRLLAPLMAALEGAGCNVRRVERDRCRVDPDALGDAVQAYLELRFFARAWALGHDAEVQVEAA